MKGDFSRYTFNKNKHYNGVLMQQGRVQLDADWNEQQAIDRCRTEAQGKDVIGPCGAPWDDPGFKITFKNGNQLNIGEGRYYADGIISENDEENQPVVYTQQPDFPEPPDILESMKGKKAALGLVYLDVWQRHITALDEPYIREKALGGPDTTTRLKTVWQVKVLPLPSVDIKKPDKLAELIEKQQKLEDELKNPSSELTPEAIEEIRSKLIEVEHKIIELVPYPLCGTNFDEWKELTDPSSGKLNAHTVQPPKDEGPCLLPPLAGYQRLENQLYRVEVHIGGTRNKAYFKWSRDNASVVTEIKNIDIAKKEITVSDVGKDEVLGFANDQWVEISDDKIELSGKPGQLVRIVSVNSATNVIELEDQPISVDMNLHPKLRRWDQISQNGLPATKDGVKMKAGWLPLEDGIEVKFSTGNYKTGDYWLIPGRTATGEIEWPPYEVPNINPTPQWPLGIKHHFCPLALFIVNREEKFYLLEDCRRLFPPVTELTSLFYVSGDGQETMPGKELPQPLLVGVANGQWPVAGAMVCFNIVKGDGQLVDTRPDGQVMTGPDGIARCRWKLDDTTPSQQVEVTLLGTGGKSLHIPIIFTANLSTADQVAYNPKDCEKLKDAYNVQLALEKLSQLTAISYYAGDGQEAPPGQGLPQLLQVSVANKCGPVDGAKVRFTAQDNGRVEESLDELSGASTNTIDVDTKDGGIASCAWKLEDNLDKPSQQLVATLIPPGGDDSNIQYPNTIVFTANLSTEGGGECTLTVGNNGLFKTLNDAFDALVQSRDICLCLLPESHVIEKDIEVEGKNSIKIIGCGADIQQTAERFFLSANSISLLDLNLNVTKNSGMVILTGNQVDVERSTFIRKAKATGPPLVTVTAHGAVADLRWKDNRMVAWRRKSAARKVSDYLIPAADVSISEAARKRFDTLMKIDPYTNKTAYDETLELVAKDIKRLNDDSRELWIRKRPTRKINALPRNLRKNVSNFYSVLGNPNADLTAVRESILAVIEAFSEFGYTEALAVGYGVGGWIEDNDIDGYLTLHYNPKFTPLAWQKATEETLAQRRAFLKRGREYIVVDPVNLTLRGNNLYAVRSNGYSIMQVMDTIMNTGDWGDHNMPETGYEFLTVTGNVFKSNGSGFVSKSIIINENTFANKANQNLGITAFVLGYSGIFVGNAGASQSLSIETMLRPDWVRECANIISIVQ